MDMSSGRVGHAMHGRGVSRSSWSLLAIMLAVAGGCVGDDPVLAAPAGSAPVVTVVGNGGGKVTGPEGVAVEIPAGALDGDIRVTVTPAPDAPSVSGVSTVGTPVTLGPEGQRFALPVTVTLAFDPARIPTGRAARDVVIYTAPAGTSSYTALPTRAVDATHAAADTTHFSTFVAGVPADLTPPIPTVLSVSNAARVTLVGSGKARGRVDGDARLRYPGFEQTTLVHTKGHIVMITMESANEPNRGPVQCSCSSYELRPDGPPRPVVSLKRLTDNPNGERTCNHPVAAADENGTIVWLYGSDSNSNRPNTYAGLLDHKCEKLAAEQPVNVPRDSNDGAPAVAYLGNGNFVAGYFSDGGGDPTTGFPAPGGDYAVAMGLSIVPGASPALERRWIVPVISPTSIGRPTIAAVDATHAILCAPKGPNRPSDDIECGLLDATSGGVVSRTTFYKSGPAPSGVGKRYYNQPTVAKVGDNQFALIAVETDGMGKNTGVKATTTRMLAFERSGDSLIKGGEIIGATPHQTHASICVGGYGEEGSPAVGVFGAPLTGIGRAAMSMVRFNTATKLFSYDAAADLWPVAQYGDSGHLANAFGRNPTRQGRDYMRCIGGVSNPGYHVPNGFMSDVKTFFAAAVHGRVPDDVKNSLFLSLLPGQMDKKAPPGDPVSVE